MATPPGGAPPPTTEAATLTAILEELKKSSKDKGADGEGPTSRGWEPGTSLEDREKLLKVEKEHATARKERIKIELELAQVESKKAENDLKKFQSETRGKDLTEAQKEEYIGLIAALDDADKAAKKLAKSYGRLGEEQQKGAQGAKTLTSNLLGLSSGFSKIVEIVPTSGEAMKSFGAELKESFLSGQLVTGIGLKIFDMFMQLAFAADEAQSKFRQMTGAGNEFNNNISAVRNNLQAAGVGFEEAGKAMESLYGGMSTFTRESDGMQTKLAGTVAVYDQLGVSMDVTTGILDQAMLSLGYDAQGSMDLVKQLDDTAVSLGKNISDVFADFATASKKLSFYGTDMINVFRKLEMQSKDTGLSIDEILGLTEQFDTFEGAGKAVGKLNALLGGPYLNSIDMLNATEAERMEMMKEAVDMSGIVFSDLSKYEQKAFAAALGTDVDTLRRSLGALTPAQEEQIKAQEKAAKRAADAKSAMEELTLALQSLIQENKGLFTDILEGIRIFADWIKKLGETRDVSKDLKNILGIIVGYKLAKWAWGVYSAFSKLALGTKLLSAAQFLWQGTMWLLTAAQTAFTVAWNLSPFIVITAIVAGIALLVLHIKNMKDAGYSVGDMLKDLGKKFLIFSGPIGMIVSFLWSFIERLIQGQSLLEALKNGVMDFANNISFGMAGKIFGFGTNVERKATGAESPQPLSIGPAVNDAVITKTGQVVKLNPGDDIMVGKSGGGLASVMEGLLGKKAMGMAKLMMAPQMALLKKSGLAQMASQKLGALGALKNLALKSLFGPLLKETISDPIVAALGGAVAAGGANGEGINVTVYIGQEQVDATVVRALESPAGRGALLPWSPGGGRG